MIFSISGKLTQAVNGRFSQPALIIEYFDAYNAYAQYFRIVKKMCEYFAPDMVCTSILRNRENRNNKKEDGNG